MASKTRIWVRCLFAIVVLSLLQSEASADSPPSDIYFDVSVRGTGSARLHARVFNNAAAHAGVTVLAVHGFTETANTWAPLANAMFADSKLRKVVRRVVAIDLVGHGESGTPTGLPADVQFGTLTVEDNADVVVQTIDILRARGLGPRVVMGHSMGGLGIETAQDQLLERGSSLAAHGVLGVILLAPVPPGNQVWTRFSNPDVSPYVKTDPILGTYLELPDAVFQVAGGFTTLAGTLAPNAPTVAQITENGYNDIEPIITALQLSTGVPLPRPSVRRGAFALRNGTLLMLLSFSQDVLTPAMDQDDVYVHLLGRSGALYRPIVASDAVHAMFTSNPTGLLTALYEMF